MLNNLYTLMREKRVTQTQMAKALQISNNSMNQKLRGKVRFTIDEMLAIQRQFFPEYSLEYLAQRAGADK